MIKVFQWASGNIGRLSGRAVLARPQMELVGLHVHSPDKVGQDAGTLLGVEPIGIAATADIDTIIASDADIVLHTALPSLVYGDRPEQDLDDFVTLLTAGKNVITVVGYMYPKAHGPEVVDRLSRACGAGNTSFHSTGLNPGWLGDLMPMTMSALSERVDQVHVLEISNFEHYPSAEIMFESMGFNSPPAEFERSNARRKRWLDGLFSESVLMTADGIGLGVEEVSSSQALALAESDLETAAGIVRRGTVAGQHWRWSGVDANGNGRMVHETVWRMHRDVAPDWPVGKHSIRFTGSPEMYLEFEPDFAWMSDSFTGTAMHAVNAIPYVVEAPAGIRTFLDLPWIMCRQHP